MKIRAYLVLLAVAAALPILVISVWSLKIQGDAGREAAMRALQAAVRAQALAVDQELYASISRLQVFATSHELQAGDMIALHDSMKAAARPTSEGWMLVVDDKGRPVLNTLVTPGKMLGPVATQGQLDNLFRLNKPYVTDLILGQVSGQRVLSVAVPVTLADGRRYVLVESLTTSLFNRLLQLGNNVPGGSTVAIFDRQGAYIARNIGAEAMVGKKARPELVEAARAQGSGQIRHRTWEGMEAWDVFTHTRHGNWIVAAAAPVAFVEGAGRQAMRLLAAGFALALLLAALLAWLFGRRLVRDIARAAEAAPAMVRGEVPALPGSSVDELHTLELAMQSAAGLIAQERAQRRAVEQERESLLESEQRARQQAEQESKSKDAFLAMLGHELRNPLSAISAGIAVIKAAGPHSDAAVRANEIIGRQSQHLERIVDDLLDTARMLAGKITLVKTALSLDEAVQACLSALRATGRIDPYEVQLELQPLVVNADPARLDQIINNLLNNAIKYTPAGGTIAVSLRAEQGQAVLEVRDNGMGMEPALLARIFEPFVQGQVSLDRSQGGLGIGLTLVKTLVELHGGTVEAHSGGEGAGSRFTVRLPLATARAREAEQFDGQGSGTRLLLVEDNPDAREMTAELLRLSGYQVTPVCCGEDALREARSREAGIAVVDIGLPDISGYEVAEQLRQDPQTRDMGLVALTGYGQEADVRRALASGFDTHLVKPVNHQKLVHAIEAVRKSRPPAT